MAPQHDSRGFTIFLLFSGLILFSAAMIGCAVVLPENEKVFVFLSGVAGNFSGALFTYLQIRNRK